MNKQTKRIFSLLSVLVLICGIGVTALAAEDDIDEAEIYLGEQTIAPASGTASVSRGPLEGTGTSNIANSPAVTGGVETVSTNESEQEAETISSPDTGAPSLLMPVGTALLALGCIPLTLKRKSSK